MAGWRSGEQMKIFYNKIKQQNKDDIVWIVLWIHAVLTSILIFAKEEKDGPTTFNKMYFLALTFLLLESALFYIKKFMTLYRFKGDKRADEKLIIPSTRMDSIMRTHSFEAKEYYNILAKNLVPVQCVSFMIILIYGLWAKIGIMQIGIIEIALLIIPQLTIILSRKSFERGQMHESSIGTKILLAIGRGLVSSVGIIVTGMISLSIMIIIVAIISSTFLLKGIDDNEAVRIVTYGNTFCILAAVFSAVLFVLGLMDFGSMNIPLRVRHRATFTALMFCIMVVSFGSYIYMGTTHNIKLTENVISYKNGSSEVKNYDIDSDVSTFRIYENSEAIKMDLTFDDGVTLNIIGDTVDDTEAWAEKYFSDYNYIAELAGRLKESGAQGELENKENLSGIVSKLDGRCQDGFEEIVAVMEGE